MGSPYRTNVSFSRLVGDAWDILRDKRYPYFPNGSRAAPSRVVFVFPKFDLGYAYDLWDSVIAPTLLELRRNPPLHAGGWNNPGSKDLVDASLRSALSESPWANKIDY